jgi:hypothetical protein
MLPSLSHSLEMIMHGSCIMARNCPSVVTSSITNAVLVVARFQNGTVEYCCVAAIACHSVKSCISKLIGIKLCCCFISNTKLAFTYVACWTNETQIKILGPLLSLFFVLLFCASLHLLQVQSLYLSSCSLSP